MAGEYFIYLVLIAVPASGCDTTALQSCASAYNSAILADALTICPSLSTYQTCVNNGKAASQCSEVEAGDYNTQTTTITQMQAASCSTVATGASLSEPLCEYGTKPKNKLTLALLEMFLGPFAADRFYLGNIASGMFKLCTAGGCCVWYLIDWIGVLNNELQEATSIHFLGMKACFQTDTIQAAKTVGQIQIALAVLSFVCSCAGSLLRAASGKSEDGSDEGSDYSVE